jgi:hypothetical protein
MQKGDREHDLAQLEPAPAPVPATAAAPTATLP